MTSVSEMSAEDRQALVQRIGEVVKKHQLEGVKVETSRETVCQLNAPVMQDNFSISVEKSYPPEMKEKVDAFKKDVDEVVKDVKGVKMNVGVKLGPGCMYDPIKKIVPIKGGEPITLEHTKGEVWLIDFWATWCPPCQKPMAHNEEMLTKRGADWGDKVKIIGISIDKDAETVVKHVESKDWQRPIHYWRGESDCSQQYAVSGVPNVMIIDTNGKIVFKGHPANRPDLEADFDALLKGETITGAGTESENKPDEPKDTAEGEAPKKELEPAQCLKDIDNFHKEVGPAL